MSTVETRGLTKLFAEVPAVNGIDLAAREGEFLVLLGPSGCGKTTLMRMIAGLEEPTAGRVLIGERDVTALPPRTRNIAMVFQSYALYPHLSVYRNIAFPLRARGANRRTIDEKVRWAAAMFGIERLLARRPRQLSGGERQRVALARAVVRQPLAFLLDEPLSNLDAKLRTLARDELKQFQRRIGTTTIYVTHDQIEAMGLGDRIAVLDQGKVRQIGTPREIYSDPADTFVATFMGSPPMNLTESDGVLLGFRPESLLPKTARSAPSALTIPMRITRVEYLGADCLIYGMLQPPFPEGPAIVRIGAGEPPPCAPGQRYEFAVAEPDLKRFHPSTGLRCDARRAGR
jgi:multiple sugar transport system ATP-binding protein